MPLPDRTVIRRRLALVGAAAVLALFVVALLARPLFDREQRSAEPTPVQKPRPGPIQIETPPLPVPPPPLSRAEMIVIASRAASAYATGEGPPARNAEVVGRNFVVRLPFGCAGPRDAEGSDSGAYWRHNAQRGTITVRAHPQVWTKAEWVQALAAPATFDAVEGFWIPRPWILSEDCPRLSPGPEGQPPAAAPSERTVGLAMFFAPNSSRVHQRGSRPYEFVGNAPADGAAIAPKGFRLVLAGRLASYESGEPVRCRGETASGRPVCLVAVEFERVAFEDPVSGKTLAEWRMN